MFVGIIIEVEVAMQTLHNVTFDPTDRVTTRNSSVQIRFLPRTPKIVQNTYKHLIKLVVLHVTMKTFPVFPISPTTYKLSCKFMTVLTLCIRYCVIISLFALVILCCVGETGGNCNTWQL